MNILTKIYRGDSNRKTRIHNEKNVRMPLKRLLLNGPRAFATAALRKAFRYRQAVPWISYSAISYIRLHLIKSKSEVLEFGSGMSTIWYSCRVKSVVSIEDSQEWLQVIKSELQKRGITNVALYERHKEDYYRPIDTKDMFDLIMIDGSYRSDCIEANFPRLKSDGVMYLDNSDKDAAGGDTRRAEELFREYASKSNRQVIEFTDFAPGQLTANEGLLMTPVGRSEHKR